MTWKNRLKLIGALAVITVIMCGLTLLFNQRQSRVASTAAVVEAPTALVGSGYGGVVIEQHVAAGDHVTRGQELFVVASSELLHDVNQGYKPRSTEAYDVNTNQGTITYRAVIDGQVEDLKAATGSYLPPGASLATIASGAAKSVLAEYELQPADYGRVEEGAAVTLNLANNQQLQGTVASISVATENNRALTSVRVECADLVDAQYANLTRVGSPVQAVLTLRDDGILAGPTTAMQQFLIKIGLR